jgi:hypothetical protein
MKSVKRTLLPFLELHLRTTPLRIYVRQQQEEEIKTFRTQRNNAEILVYFVL